MSSRGRSSHSQTRRRLWPLLLLGGGAVLVIALGILALPFRHAPAHAEAAKTQLELAKTALGEGKQQQAREAIERASDDAAELQASVQGFGGDVWSRIPVIGGPVSDVRHLGNAMEQLTAAADAGAEAWPKAMGEKSTLFNGGSVDLELLDEISNDARVALDGLAAAEEELNAVADSRPILGTRFADARDSAQSELAPLSEKAKTYGPLLDVMPKVMGGEGKRTYIVAILNPAEMLYSGGTAQTFTSMTYDDGKLTWEDTIDFRSAPWLVKEAKWKKVPSNPFHRGTLKVATSTMAPDWAVSGEELLTAWETVSGEQMDGVLALDVVALAELMKLTGPIFLPEAGGPVTGENLVKTVSGSYDNWPDPEDRKWMNWRIAKMFGLTAFTGGPVETGRILGTAAQQRHFALYLKNADEQAAMDELGVTGRLAETDRDYLGVFTQMRIPSKSDYWQRRAVRSDVDVREDGSAHVKLEVEVFNDSPPYLQPYPDPREHYFTRWSNLSVLTMLPEGAEIASTQVDGVPAKFTQGAFDGRSFQRQSIEFEPRATHTVTVEYDVPSAAHRSGGSLAYGLAIDPQGMVNAQSVAVNVRFPQGYIVNKVPAGWQTSGTREASYTTPALLASESFEVVAQR